MSKIDERITKLTFDNKQFEKGISESSKSLTDFNNHLDKSGETTGFGNLSGVVGNVSDKFSALGTIGVGALLEIGRQAVQVGQQLANSLAIEPITQGFQEYELKIDSIKTMLASAKTKEGLPVTLEMVNEELEKLNLYADQTIYSFSDMTSNIGKFTNAGVDLETAVQAIKGISNAAALSGANSNEASRAMYNFAQALSAGYVKLIDWKSIENANMATVEFKTQLLDAAVAAGTVEKTVDGMYRVLATNNQGKTMDLAIDATRNFNDSLQYQWMTTEVLTGTLSDFASMETEIGKKANEAATKVRTFSQLMDTTKEAVGSGWSQSFELMFGDFEEATEVWSSLSDALGNMIGASSEARNQILNDWDSLGGRTSIIEGIKSAWAGLQSILDPIREAFENVFPPMTGKKLAEISQKFKELMDSIKIGPETSEKLKTAFQGLFSALSLGWDTVKFVFTSIKTAIDALLPSGDIILGLAAKIGQFFIDLKTAADHGEFFIKITNGVREAISGISNKIKEVAGVLFNGGGIPEAVKLIVDAFKGFPSKFPGFDSFTEKITKFFKPLKDFLEPIGTFLVKMFKSIKEALASTWRTEGFGGFADILNTLLTGGILVGIQKLVKGFTNITESAGGFLKGITGVLDGLKGSLQAYQDVLKAKVLLEIATAVGILAASLIALAMIEPEKLTSASIAMGVLFAELATTFVTLEKTMSGTKIAKVGIQLIEFSTAILILSHALQNIAEIPTEQLSQSILALAVMLGEMVGVAKLMQNTKGFGAAAFALIEMAVAIKLVVSSVRPLGEMDANNLQQGLLAVGAIAAGMAAFAAIISKLGNGGTLLAAGAAMGLIGVAILEITGAVAILGALNAETMMQGLNGLGIILAEIGAFSILISKTVNPVKMVAAAAAMVAMGLALVEISAAVAILGSLDTGNMIQGLAGLAAAMGVMVAAMLLTANPMVLAGAAAMLVMAAAMVIFTPAIIALGLVPLENIGKAILALVGIFAVMGGAAAILAPLTPVIIALAAAIALLGVAVLAIGTGMALFGAGLAALGAGGTAAIALLVIAITELANLIPLVLTKIGQGIVALAGVITTGAPAIAEAIIAVVASLITLLTGEIPKLITVVLTFIGELLIQLVDKVPEFVDAGMKIIIGFLEGIVNNLQQVIEAILGMIVAILEGIAAKLPDVIQAGANIIIAFLEGIGQQVPRVIDAGFKMIIDFINGLANSIRENTPLLLDAIVNLCTAFLDGILAFFGIRDGTSEEGQSLGKSILQGIIDGIASMLMFVVDAIIGVGKAIINIFKNLFEFVGDLPGIMIKFGKGIINGLINGIKSVVSGLFNLIKDILSGMINVIKEGISGFIDGGKNIVGGIINGIKSVGSGLFNIIKELLSGMINVIKEGISGFIDVGKNIVDGIINGIKSMISSVVDTVKNLASSALDGIKNFLGIASPSKAFAEIGRYCDEGMAYGIAKYADLVTDETEALGNDSLKTMETTMSKLADAIDSDLDASPVITPVLDLSSVKSGANALSSLLNKDQAYGLAASISRSEQTNAANQNGTQTSDNSTTVINRFDLSNLTVRQESDVDAIAKKLYQKQQSAMRGKGMRVAYTI